jgi:hypothetical protein
VDEERICLRQLGDEVGIDGEVALGAVACAASAAIAAEGLLEEETAALLDQRVARRAQDVGRRGASARLDPFEKLGIHLLMRRARRRDSEQDKRENARQQVLMDLFPSFFL